jgi:hypothetical protein
MWNGNVWRFATIAAGVAALIIPCMAGAVVVDFNSSTDRTATTVFGFQHMVTARGYGGGDANGPGSNLTTRVGNGLRDGIEFSLFEYVYANDFASLPGGALKTRLQDLHAQAVAKFDANVAALVDIIDDQAPNIDDGLICGHGRWGTDGGTMADSGVSPSFQFPDCASNTSNGFMLEIMVNVTLDEYLDYPSAWFGLVLNWNPTTPYNFAADPNFDNSLSAVFGPDGDIDNDGITNLEEINAVNNDILTAFGSDYDAGSREQRDLAHGWYVDQAILNQSYVPSMGAGEGEGGGEGVGEGEGEGVVEGEGEGAEILYIVSNPAPGFIEEDGYLTLTAPLGSGLSYEWYFNHSSTPMSDTHRITGTNSRVLRFAPVLKEDEGPYTCVYDAGTAKALVETPPFELTVLDAGSLPIAGMAGLCLLAVACLGTGVRFAARGRK